MPTTCSARSYVQALAVSVLIFKGKRWQKQITFFKPMVSPSSPSLVFKHPILWAKHFEHIRAQNRNRISLCEAM
jgi:hypothetical protein